MLAARRERALNRAAAQADRQKCGYPIAAHVNGAVKQNRSAMAQNFIVASPWQGQFRMKERSLISMVRGLTEKVREGGLVDRPPIG